jgi:hypothetical protein
MAPLTYIQISEVTEFFLVKYSYNLLECNNVYLQCKECKEFYFHAPYAAHVEVMLMLVNNFETLND